MDIILAFKMTGVDGIRMPGPLGSWFVSGAAFLFAVLHIVALGAPKQMMWVDASWIVTTVKREHFGAVISGCKNQRETVRADLYGSYAARSSETVNSISL